jgi:hypothetical protein
MSSWYGENYEYTPEMDSLEGEHFGSDSEAEAFSEAEVMEFSEQLLGVTDEAELDKFLGGVLKTALGGIAGQFLSPSVVNKVGGFLKGAARDALPLAAQAVGGYFGGPLGAQIGRGVAAAGGNAFGLEAELNAEDREFDGAKKFVQMAADAVRTAATAPPDIDPSMIASTAVTAAAERHAPGLLDSTASSRRGHNHSGRWVRRGRNIVIMNCG